MSRSSAARPFPHPARTAWATALAAACLAGTGCGAGTGDGPAAEADKGDAAHAAALKHARCMRDNGVDMPDPKVNERGVVLTLGQRPGDDAAMATAERACRHLRPRVPQPTADERQELADRALRFDRCMREHGVDLPAPRPDGGRDAPDVDPDDPTFLAATKACSPSGSGVAVPAVPAG
jgi:hypothetical protein